MMMSFLVKEMTSCTHLGDETPEQDHRNKTSAKVIKRCDGKIHAECDSPLPTPSYAHGGIDVEGTKPSVQEKNNNKSTFCSLDASQNGNKSTFCSLSASQNVNKTTLCSLDASQNGSCQSPSTHTRLESFSYSVSLKDICYDALGRIKCDNAQSRLADASRCDLATTKRKDFVDAKDLSDNFQSCSSSFSHSETESPKEEDHSRLGHPEQKVVFMTCPKEHEAAIVEECDDPGSRSNLEQKTCQIQGSTVRFGLDSSEEIPQSLTPSFTLSFGTETPLADSMVSPSSAISPTNISRSDEIIVCNSASLDGRKTSGRGAPHYTKGSEPSVSKQKLTMRISRSLGTFFQKSPSKPSPSDSLTDFQEAGPCGSPEKSSLPIKESKRQTTLAGRMVTSLAQLGRKGLQKGRSADSLDEDEEFFNNNRDTPVFVLPEDQVDVSDKAPVPLTEEQGQLLKESWVIIKKHVTEVGVETFIGLFNTHPESIDSFLAFKDKSVQDLERSAVLKAHALRVMQTVDKCITRLDKPERMTSLLLQLGKRHVDYQANIKLIPIIGKQFIGAIEPKMGNAWSHDIKASWAGLFSIINYNMRLGLMEEKNKRIQASKDIESSRKKSEEKRRRDRK